MVASTASPYKFAKNVYGALFGDNNFDELEILTELSAKTESKIPTPLFELDKKEIKFNGVTDSNNMLSEVMNFIEK